MEQIKNNTIELQEILATVNALPSAFTPNGTITIKENGLHDVTNYASANVQVSSSGGADIETCTIEVNNANTGGYFVMCNVLEDGCIVTKYLETGGDSFYVDNVIVGSSLVGMCYRFTALSASSNLYYITSIPSQEEGEMVLYEVKGDGTLTFTDDL